MSKRWIRNFIEDMQVDSNKTIKHGREVLNNCKVPLDLDIDKYMKDKKLVEEPCEETGKGCSWEWCELCNDVHCGDCIRARDYDKEAFNDEEE